MKDINQFQELVNMVAVAAVAFVFIAALIH